MKQTLLLVCAASCLLCVTARAQDKARPCDYTRTRNSGKPPLSRKDFDDTFGDIILKEKRASQRSQGINLLVVYVCARGVAFRLNDTDRQSLRARWGRNDSRLIEKLIAAVDEKAAVGERSAEAATAPQPHRAASPERELAVISDGYNPTSNDNWSETFADDGSSFAYAARLGSKEFVIFNGWKGPEFDGVGPPLLSPDGRSVAYAAREIRTVDSVRLIVIDGKTVGQYSDIGRLTFSPDGKKLAYYAKKRDEDDWVLYVHDGSGLADRPAGPPKFKTYEKDLEPAFSRDGAGMAYVAWEGSEKHVVGGKKLCVNDTVLDVAAEFGQPAFSPDGDKLAAGKYPVTKEKLESGEYQWGIAVYDLVNGGAPEEGRGGSSKINTPVFNPDNRRVLYVDGGGGYDEHIVWGGVQGANFHHVGYPTFSPDGRRIAYAAKTWARGVAVIDEQLGDWFNDVGPPVFSPDSGTVAYAVQENGKAWIVVGDKSGPHFDRVGKPVFSRDGSSVEYGARDGRRLLWKTMKVPVDRRGREAPSRQSRP
jgi:Tol biopolymer transport system component